MEAVQSAEMFNSPHSEKVLFISCQKLLFQFMFINLSFHQVPLQRAWLRLLIKEESCYLVPTKPSL